MLLPLAGRRLYYDLVGPEEGPVVCITHSLASDGGMWAEQMPPLLQAGFRVLAHRHARARRQRPGRRRLHDDRTRRRRRRGARGARDPARALYRPVDRRHDRPGLRDRARRQADLGAVERHLAGEPRRCSGSVGRADEHGAPGELARAARRQHDGALVHRCVQAEQAGAVERDPRHRRGDDARRIPRLLGGDHEFRFHRRSSRRSASRLLSCAAPTIRARRRPRTGGSPVWFPAAATRRSPKPAISPMSSTPRRSTGS